MARLSTSGQKFDDVFLVFNSNGELLCEQPALQAGHEVSEVGASELPLDALIGWGRGCDTFECEGTGGICTPVMTLLDGRSFTGGIEWLGLTTLRDLEGIAIAVSGDETKASLKCTGALIAREYSTEQVKTLARVTARLSL